MSDKPVLTILPGGVAIGSRPFPARPVEQPPLAVCGAIDCHHHPETVYTATAPLRVDRLPFAVVDPGVGGDLRLCREHAAIMWEWAQGVARDRLTPTFTAPEPGTLDVEARRYLRLLVRRDVKMLRKKRAAIKPGGDEERMRAESARKEAYSRVVYVALGGDLDDLDRDDRPAQPRDTPEPEPTRPVDSCATCWPRPCGEPPHRSMCRRAEARS